LQATKTYSGISNPQDFFFAHVGLFATTGTTGSVVFSSSPGNVSFVGGIAGAAGVSGHSTRFVTGRSSYFVLVTSPDTNRVFLIQASPSPPALPNAFNVSNGASFGTAQVAPGELSSVFATTGVNQNFYAAAIPLPRTLGGVTLKIGGTLTFNSTTGNWDYSPTGAIDAPLVFVGPNQINFQIPPGVELGDSVPAQLTKSDGSRLLSTVRITATAPGIFTVLQNGQGQGAVLNQNNTQNFGTNPAVRGSVIQIFATGGGATTPALLPGEAAPSSGNPLVTTTAQPTVTIGGVNAIVKFSGMAPGWVGLWQINAEIPASVTPGSAVPLVVTSGGVQSNTVTIAVQ
jgi:uncharacterized protein (TIGR03437 family)